MAIMALAEWGQPAWPDEARGALQEAIVRERDERVRMNMQRVLAGEQPS
jgi:hypothetical protein